MLTNNSRMGHDVWFGFGLGDVQNEVCSWDTANPNVDTSAFQPGAGKTEHRREGFDYRPGGPEINFWRTRAPPSPRHKMADPSLRCRPLGRPPARSSIPNGRSIPEPSTPRSAGSTDQPRKAGVSRTCLTRMSGRRAMAQTNLRLL